MMLQTFNRHRSLCEQSLPDIAALRAFGFSTGKAIEIELDARRGDAVATHFLSLAKGKKK